MLDHPFPLIGAMIQNQIGTFALSEAAWPILKSSLYRAISAFIAARGLRPADNSLCLGE